MKKIICIFSNILQNISSKSPFYEKMKMTTKRTVVLESIIVGSFDCDRTMLEDPKYHKHECTILQCYCTCCALLRWVHSPQCSYYLDLKGILGMDLLCRKDGGVVRVFSNRVFKQHLVIPTHAIGTLGVQSIQGNNTQLPKSLPNITYVIKCLLHASSLISYDV